MRVTVKFGDTAEVVRLSKQIENETPLISVLKALAEGDECFREKVFDPAEEKMRQEFFVLINDRLCASHALLDTRINNCDELVLVPPVTGG